MIDCFAAFYLMRVAQQDNDEVGDEVGGNGENIRAVDAFAFAQLARDASGEVALASLARFVAGLPEQADGEAGLLRWSARGERDAYGKSFLHLHLRAAPVVQCQRCLAPFALPVDSCVTLELVRSESDLDEGGLVGAGDEADVDAPDKVLGARRFDLLAHIEDELILAVPYITRHPVCPTLPTALEQSPSGQQQVSPFAALKKLKGKQ